MGILDELSEIDTIDEAITPKRWLILDLSAQNMCFRIDAAKREVMPIICNDAEEVIKILYGGSMDPSARTRFVPVKVPDAAIEEALDIGRRLTEQWRTTNKMPPRAITHNYISDIVASETAEAPPSPEVMQNLFKMMMEHRGPLN